MLKNILISGLMSLTMVSSMVQADDSDKNLNEIITTFTAVFPFGQQITNDLGYPYQLIITNLTNDIIPLEDMNISFSTENCGYYGDDLNTVKMSYGNRFPAHGVYSVYSFDYNEAKFNIDFGSLMSTLDSNKALYPEEALTIDILSPYPLGGAYPRSCIEGIEESIRVSVN